jgi:hypothetical protein
MLDDNVYCACLLFIDVDAMQKRKSAHGRPVVFPSTKKVHEQTLRVIQSVTVHQLGTFTLSDTVVSPTSPERTPLYIHRD